MYIPEGSDSEFKFEFSAPSYPELEESVARSVEHLCESERDFIMQRVYPYANFWHQNQKPRMNGLPYISHPVEVAAILAPYKLDVSSMAAAILHDVHEDNEDKVSLDDIEHAFGTDIRNLVDGLTKIGKASARQRREAAAAAVSEASVSLAVSLQAALGIDFGGGIGVGRKGQLSASQLKERAKQAKLDDKAASLAKLVTEMLRDLRVIIVKLADRLHNMRTLGGLRPDKRVRIAQETLNFFAPLATRLGMWPFKTELEDLCFVSLEPEQYRILGLSLEREREKRSGRINETLRDICEALGEEKVKAKVTLRKKSLYSVFSKMRRQHKTLEQIFDLDPISVVVPDKNTCYQALRVIHHRFGFLQGKFRDYIANPKGNNYQALHTTVPGFNRQPVEVQICSEEEDAENYYGVLNVFVSGRYEDEKMKDSPQQDTKHLFSPFATWLTSLSHIREGAHGDQDFLDILCQEELSAGVSCTTPGGEQIELPQGAVPLDFAFKIHTELGLRCTGAIVNDHRVSITEYELRDNDVVQILAADKDCPQREWVACCRTRQARSTLSKWFYSHESAEVNRSIGYRMACTELIRQGAAGVQSSAEIMGDLVSILNCGNVEELYVNLGSCRLPIGSFAKALQTYREANPRKFANLDYDPERLDDVSLSVRIENSPQARIFVCRRCLPVCGDSIQATKGVKDKGFFIHRDGCPLLQNATLEGSEVYSAEWISNVEPKLFVLRATIRVEALVRHGLSNSIISVFDNRDVLIYKYQFTNDYVKNFTSISIEVGTDSVSELEMLMEQIKKVESVVSVDRSF